MTDERRPVITREDLEDAERARTGNGQPEPSDNVERHGRHNGPAADDTDPTRLFESDRARELQQRWTDVQARFVDDPQAAVKSADALVDEVIRDLSALFSDERSRLEAQWGSDRDVSTEDLRIALRRYRSFFERLLSI